MPDSDARGPRRLQSLIRVLAQCALLPHGLALHGAGLTARGHAYAFVGPRGAGKTTLAGSVPAAARLGDDFVIAHQDGSAWSLHPTPFPGREGTVAGAIAAPLRAIAFLVQAPETLAVPLTLAQAVARLVPCVVHAGADRASQTAVLDCLARLVGAVPIFDLHLSLHGPAIAALEASL